jgi:hypothetical protein
MKVLAACLLMLAFSWAQSGGSANRPASETEAMYRAAAESAERKFQHIQQNATLAHPDQTPTELTEREINAYLASGRVKLPNGVQRVQLTGESGAVTGNARVDFDQITAGRRSMNPLLSLFSGVHDVRVDAHASGSGGQGRVHIDAAAIDGMTVPRVALQYFVDKYVTPKYPNVGMDSTFQMPDRIDTATIGSHKLIVTQK